MHAKLKEKKLLTKLLQHDLYDRLSVSTPPFVEFIIVYGHALYQMNLMDRPCES